jgi:endonuclease VIII
MPEGHTIHRLARDLSRHLVGHELRVWSPQGRFASDAERVDGAVLHELEPYGKHLFWHWSTGEIGHVHLGLFGRFRVHRGVAPEPGPAVRMRLEAPEITVDLSGPTACSVDAPDVRERVLARLGPDPLRRDAIAEVAIDRIARSRAAIGALLLDQSVLCGVGNVYRAEALFVSGIHPVRPGRECDPAELRALWNTVVAMLRAGVKANRIVTVDRSELDIAPGTRIRRGEATYVYHRPTCLRCSSTVGTVELAGRPCWYCPTCQH